VLRLACSQIRVRPASFLGLAIAQFVAISAITLFGSLIFASFDAPAPEGNDPSLAMFGGAFGEIAIFAALFVVANTLSFSIRQQHRDLALLRTVAATPFQVRRLVRWQVLLVVVAVSPFGWSAGAIGAGWFIDELVERDLAPVAVGIPTWPVPMLIASVVATLIGMISAAVTARRISRIAPAEAMYESTSQVRGVGWFRLLLGVLVLGAGVFFCFFLSTQPPDKSGQGALLAAIVLMLAVGLLGPILGGLVIRPLSLPLRAVSPQAGWLADANLRGYTHRLSSAVVPMTLLIGLSCTFLFVGDTIGHAQQVVNADLSSINSASDVWLRQVELILLFCFGGVSTLNTLAALTAERRREFALLRLIGATRRQLARMLCAEIGLTAAVGVAAGTLIAAAAATAFSVTLPGSPLPTISPVSYLLTVAGAIAVTSIGVVSTGVHATSGSATELAAGYRG
jgi:putative ABC transport system permease protein